jgi:alkylhydroperoxidase family enzyme
MTRYDFDSTPRIAPAAELAPDVEAAITAVMRGRPPLLLFTTLARDERLFRRFFGGGLLDRGHLTLRQREIVIDRTTALCRAEYEWGVHVATYSEAAGLTREQIVSLTSGSADDSCWTEPDALLIRLADALHRDATVDDRLWSALREHYSEMAVVELLMVAGFYRTTSYLVNALALPLEPGAARFADHSDWADHAS